MVLFLAAAQAADLKLHTPHGAARAGVRTTVELVVVDERGPVHGAIVEMSPRRGRLLGPVEEVGPGRYDVPWVAPGGVDEEVFQVHVAGKGPYELRLPLVAPVAGSLAPPREQEVPPGASRVELQFSAADVPALEDVVVRASEGTILDVVREPAGLRVAVEPAATKDARMLYVGVWDRRSPDRAPVWGAARLRARHTGTVAVEPASQVTVRVGTRSYGPFTADARGDAPISFESLPGEQSYEVVATDAAGNSSRVTSPLGGDPGRPIVVALEAGEADRASVQLAAWTVSGSPWTASAPACRVGRDDSGVAVATAKGQWRYDVDAPRSLAMFDLRIECTLGDTVVPLRLPLGVGVPERIELRAFPETLDADFPIAQVQATLVDTQGDRLAPDGLEVRADHGVLQLARAGDALRGEYQGQDAVSTDGDTVRATWRPTPGTGLPWRIALSASPVEGGVDVRARVLDRADHPLAGVAVNLEVGSARESATSDAAGWVRARIPGARGRLELVHATAGTAQASAAIFGSTAAPLPDPDAPDLSATVELRLRAGRVRTVLVEGPPTPVLTGTDDSAVIRVRLLDNAGNPVDDEVVMVTTDYGTVTGLTPLGDGRWTAQYRPAPGLADRLATVSVTAAGASGGTTVRLQPRPVRGGVAAGVGWITNFGQISSPTASLSAEYRLPFFSVLSARIGASLYQVDSEVTESGLDAPVSVRSSFYPVELGVVATQRWTRWSAGGGIAAAIVPFALSARYDGDLGLQGGGIGPPGMQLRAEVARRLGMSELFVDLRFLVFPSPTGAVSFDGTAGGLTLGAGYRVLY